jgi:hypothetical protein
MAMMQISAFCLILAFISSQEAGQKITVSEWHKSEGVEE